VGATVHDEPWPLFHTFLIIQTVGMTPWAEDQLVERPLPTQANTNTEETQTNIYASSGIRTHDPSVSAGKTVHALDSAATVMGIYQSCHTSLH
jgi:hypothetical protein